MELELGQLRALRAAVDAGTIEGAARALHERLSEVVLAGGRQALRPG